MVCSACQDKPVDKACDACGKLPPVLQVKSEECPVLFHTVELEGTREDNPPYIGMYKNTLLTYTADSAKYLFNSDGIYSLISGGVKFDEIQDRPKYGGVEMTSETDIPNVDEAIAAEAEARDEAIAAETSRATAAEESLSSSISSEAAARSAADAQIESKLNTNVLADLEMNTDATAVSFIEDKKNLFTGTTSSETDTIPLASETQAGILNAAGYQSIKNSQDRLDALAGGAVSVSNLPAEPTQEQLTTAWETATGEEEVFNRASIFDSTNGKNWTYFENTSEWEVTGELNQTITLENFSQGQAGLIVGDNTDGKVYAEQDGTGSVYGWDALKSRVSNVESDVSTLDTDKQDKLTAGTNITIDANNTISASGGGIPTTAKFFDQVYDSANNRVASNTLNIGVPGDNSNSRTLVFSPTGGPSANTALVRGYPNGRLDLASGRDNLLQFSAYNYVRMILNANSLTGQHPNGAVFRIKDITDPVDAQDVATKNYVDNLTISYAALNGTAAPTTATEGKYVGQLYYDATNEQLYYLASIDTSVTPTEYTWETMGGGSSVNVVQTTGISTTDVMSQKAVTDCLYGKGSGGIPIKSSVVIGPDTYQGTYAQGVHLGHINSSYMGSYSIAIGDGSGASDAPKLSNGAYRQIAIGGATNVAHDGSIALGFQATTSRSNELSIGKPTGTRFIANVRDPQLAQDAATKNYVDTQIASAGAPVYTPSEFNTLWEEA